LITLPEVPCHLPSIWGAERAERSGHVKWKPLFRRIIVVAQKPLEDQLIGASDQARSGVDIHVEPSARWVRAVVGGVPVADSKQVLTVTVGLPVYYFPLRDVRADLFEPSDRNESHRALGDRSFFHLRVGDRFIQDAAWRFHALPPEAPKLEGHVAFYWDRLDHWYEEDDEVFVHPRDPHHRVDVLNSSRHVRVVVGGEVVADSRRPRLLFETGLPTRYYLPHLDVRMELLDRSETVTQCPYKGRTVHYDLAVGDRAWRDIAWSYPFPIPECPKIENLICFYDERVDMIEVDGEAQPRPETPWSR
jgi:uncharacterized protein (DUF427 family)